MTTHWTCPHCQSRIGANMRFCPHCGREQSTRPETDQPPGRLSRRWLWAGVIGLWLVGLAALAVGVGIWSSRQSTEPAEAVVVITEPPTATPSPQPTAPATETATPPPSPESSATPHRLAARQGDTLAVATPTLTPQPSPNTPAPIPPSTATSPPPPAPTPVCPPGARITTPAPGTRFTQRQNFVLGIANIPNFDHWRIEYSTTSDGGWNYLLERNYPVQNDKLVMIDASTIPRGPYGLRLTVVDVTGNYPEPCEVWYINSH